MASITVWVHIDAPIEAVWPVVADLASHAQWMADAQSIEFLTEQRSGVGTKMRVATAVGPLRTTDLMEVTNWVEGETIGVNHTGLVSGSGRFEMSTVGGGTRFTWSEDLTFPWHLGGPITAALARPVLRWVWKRNLTGLKARVETM